MNALDFQRQIYLGGFAGRRPVVPPDWSLLEEKARQRMSPEAAAYIIGGAGRQDTIRQNRQDFGRWQIVPRMLRNVEATDTGVDLLGMTLPAPLLLAPIGVLEMVHPDADVAVARAAAETGTPYIFSNQASVPMETCAGQMADSPRLFQLYWSKSRELVISLLQRAEACGCRAIVVTLDTTVLGWRTPDLTLGHLPFLFGKGIAQYTSDPVFQRLLDEYLQQPAEPRPALTLALLRNLSQTVRRYPDHDGARGFVGKLRSGRPLGAVRLFTSVYTNQTTTWDDLSFLRQHTRLPILLKGILHADDARRAVDAGMDGIIVSNHGGRQVDGSVSSIVALPGVVAAVGGQVPVLLDSGIRGGADLFKALALGASAVCLGRPYVYGLTLAGQSGVAQVIGQVRAEFELTMRLSGCCNVGDIGRDNLNPDSVR
jgi:lactate 2-monooxygenase